MGPGPFGPGLTVRIFKFSQRDPKQEYMVYVCFQTLYIDVYSVLKVKPALISRHVIRSIFHAMGQLLVESMFFVRVYYDIIEPGPDGWLRCFCRLVDLVENDTWFACNLKVLEDPWPDNCFQAMYYIYPNDCYDPLARGRL